MLLLPARDRKTALFVCPNVEKYSSTHIFTEPLDTSSTIPSFNNHLCDLPSRFTKDSISERSISIWGQNFPFCMWYVAVGIQTFVRLNMISAVALNCLKDIWSILTRKKRELLSGKVALIFISKIPETNSVRRSNWQRDVVSTSAHRKSCGELAADSNFLITSIVQIKHFALFKPILLPKALKIAWPISDTLAFKFDVLRSSRTLILKAMKTANPETLFDSWIQVP